MKLYVIITTPDYDLWEEAGVGGWATEEREGFELRSRELSDKKVVVLPQFPSRKRRDKAWERETKAKTTERVRTVLQRDHADEVYIMAHANTLDWKKIRSSTDSSLTEEEFRHTEGDSIYEAVQNLIREVDIESEIFSELEEVSEENRRQTLAQKLRVLKHRLSHFFLPVEIDLQGWRESDFEEGYGGEIKRDHEVAPNDGEMHSLLDKSRDLLYYRDNESGEDSAEALIEEAGLTSSPQWTAVQRLLPKEGRRGSNSFKAAKTVVASLESGKLSRVKAKIERGNSFQKWFSELDQALDELCEAVENAGTNEGALR